MVSFSFPGKSFFFPSIPALPSLPPPPTLPTPEDPSIKQRATDVALARKRASGLTGTIKTSGLGDTSEPTVTRKTLGA